VHRLVVLGVLRLVLRLELGPEFDSNANRTELLAEAANPDPPVASALVRTTARVGLTWRRGINTLRFSTSLGAKIFFNPDVLDQSVLVVQGGLEDRIRLGRTADLSFAGDYYDAFQDLIGSVCSNCLRRRDFRTGRAGMRLTLFDGPGAFWVGGGYRGFYFKSDPYYSFQAATAEAGASVTVQLGDADNSHELSVGATYYAEPRFYDGTMQYLGDDGMCTPEPAIDNFCLLTGTDARLDHFHNVGVEVAYVGTLLASLGYDAQLNRSNSFGQSLLRHVVTLKLGYRLPWQLYATLKAQLMITKYLDPVLLDRRVSNLPLQGFEDENRNAIIVDLERAWQKVGLAVNARYSFFTNELGSPPTSFRRHVAYLGLTYRFQTR
jgi:hypothetical protein